MLEQPAFGRQLRALRLEQGLSQAHVAAGGLSAGHLSRLESGTRPPPTRRVLEHLCRQLGVPPSVFGTGPHRSLAQALALAASSAQAGKVADELAVQLETGMDRLDPALRWQSLWLLAEVRDEEARYEDEHALLEELSELSEAIGVPELIVRARTRLSRCFRLLRDNARACAEAEAAHRLSAGLSVADRTATLHALISAQTEAGRLAEARAHAGELCEITAAEPGVMHIEALWAASTVRTRQGDHAGAQRLLERALERLGREQDLLLWVRLAAASAYLRSPGR